MLKHLLLCILTLGIFKSFAQEIKLTAEETKYVKDNPTITIGIDEQFEPFVIKDKNGKITGFEAEYLEIISRLTGLNIELVGGTWDEMVQSAMNWEIDGLAYSSIIEERTKKLTFTDSYLSSNQIIYSHNESRIVDATSLDDFAGKTIAVQKNDAFNTNIAKNIRNSKIIYFESIDEIIDALAARHIDYAIGGPNLNFIAAKNLTPNIFINYIIKEFPCDIVYSLRNDSPLLKSIINKGINNISPSVKNKLINKWLIGGSSSKNIKFSKKELDFITNHRDISFGGTIEDIPFVFIKDGKPTGIEFELIEKINNLSGLNIKIFPDVWNVTLEKAKIQKLDGLVTSIKSEARASYFNFTSPYLDVYTAIFSTKTQKHKASEIDDLDNKRVGVLKGFEKVLEALTSNPKIIPVEYDSRKDLTQALLTKEIDYVIGMSSYEYYLSINGINSIKLDFLINEEPLELRYSIRKDWPELVTILDKCILEISKKDRINMLKNWAETKHNALLNHTLHLSKEEKQILKRKKSLKIGYIGNWYPIVDQDEEGEIKGIMQKYFVELEKQLELKLEPIYTENSQYLFSKLNDNELDYGITAQISGSSDHHINTVPIFKEPFALITTSKVTFKNNLHYVKNFKVGIDLLNPFINDLKKEYPNITFIPEEKIEFGLNQLSNNDLDGYVTLLPMAIYSINSSEIKNLAIGSVLDLEVAFQLTGTSNEITEITPILNKGIESISKTEIFYIKEYFYQSALKKHTENTSYYIFIGTVILIMISALIIGVKLNSKKEINSQPV